MTRRMMFLLLLGGALAVALGLDRLWLAPQPEMAAPPQPVSVADPAPMSQGALNPAAGLAPDLLAPVFDRPLFRPSRSQTLPESAEIAVPNPEPDPVAIAPDLTPTLLGTVNLPKPGGAFLAEGGSGETAFVAVGQSFGPWRLLSVGDGWVELEGPDGALRLAFPQPQQPAAETATP